MYNMQTGANVYNHATYITKEILFFIFTTSNLKNYTKARNLIVKKTCQIQTTSSRKVNL